MSTVIAYQSLNSSASSNHGLAASTSQRFLRQAHRKLAPKYASNGGALKYPTNTDYEPHDAIHGPAELVPVSGAEVKKVTKPSSTKTNSKKRTYSEMAGDQDTPYSRALDSTLSMVESKALQIYQQTYRELSLGCDLIVFGELNSSHPDWHRLARSAGKRHCSSIKPLACNCFSLHSSRYEGSLSLLASGEGWCAARCNGVLAVFVHVPNSKAKKQKEMILFYQNIKTTLLNTRGGGVVDLVMGDTNQSSAGFTPQVISKGMGLPFRDADTNQGFKRPVDTWTPGNDTLHKGTNAANNKKYDVAVYNTDTVKKIDVKYFTQFSVVSQKAAAYTDHMGVVVNVEKK